MNVRSKSFAQVVVGVVAVFALVGGPASLGCATLYSKDDLEIAAGKHHIDLRWGRISAAADKVVPELRPEFMKSWSEAGDKLELQEVEVTALSLSSSGDSADLVVRVVYVDRADMQVKTVTLPEKWKRTSEGWVVEKPAILVLTGAQPASISEPGDSLGSPE